MEYYKSVLIWMTESFGLLCVAVPNQGVRDISNSFYESIWLLPYMQVAMLHCPFLIQSYLLTS